jgi:hypothetical protein
VGIERFLVATWVWQLKKFQSPEGLAIEIFSVKQATYIWRLKGF